MDGLFSKPKQPGTLNIQGDVEAQTQPTQQQQKAIDKIAGALKFVSKNYGAPVEHVYLAVQWMVLAGVVPANATDWAKDFSAATNVPGEWAGFAAALATPTILSAVAEAIEKRDQGALKSALAAASKALSSPGTYGCVGALGNAIGFPGAAQMFLIAFTMGTAANTKALYDSIGNSAVSKEQKVKFLFDAAINGLQAIGCVFGLDAIGMGDTNPAANPDANTQQWLMTACSAGALAGALWEVGEAVKPTVDAMRNLGVFGKPKAGQANAPTETTNLLAGAPAPTQEV